jgi:hypothetical protein
MHELEQKARGTLGQLDPFSLLPWRATLAILLVAVFIFLTSPSFCDDWFALFSIIAVRFGCLLDASCGGGP